MSMMVGAYEMADLDEAEWEGISDVGDSFQLWQNNNNLFCLQFIQPCNFFSFFQRSVIEFSCLYQSLAATYVMPVSIMSSRIRMLHGASHWKTS
jgi:hypothetical protein